MRDPIGTRIGGNTLGSVSRVLRASASWRDAHTRLADVADKSRTVVVARTPDEIEAIRGSWQMFDLPSVHHDIDFYLAKVRSRPAVLRPHTILLQRDGQAEAIAIGRVEGASLECKLGYKTVYRPRVRLLVERPGVLFRAGSESASRALISELIASLARGEAEGVSFYGLEPNSALYRAAREMPSVLCRGGFVPRERHWTLELPDSIDAFLASRSRHARGEIRGLDHRLARKYGKRLSVRIFQTAEEINPLFADLDRVGAKTYQRALNVSSAETEGQRDAILFAMSRGWFRAFVLYLDDEPVAYWSGFLYRGKFSGSKTGYDPAYKNDRVGTYLLVRMIENLCGDDAVQVIDYGCGEAEYKRRFSNSCLEEAHPLIFAPTLTGIRVNVARTAITASDKYAKRTLERTGVLKPVRKRWRERVSGGQTRSTRWQATKVAAAAPGWGHRRESS